VLGGSAILWCRDAPSNACHGACRRRSRSCAVPVPAHTCTHVHVYVCAPTALAAPATASRASGPMPPLRYLPHATGRQRHEGRRGARCGALRACYDSDAWMSTQGFYAERLPRTAICQGLSRIASDLIVSAFDTPFQVHAPPRPSLQKRAPRGHEVTRRQLPASCLLPAPFCKTRRRGARGTGGMRCGGRHAQADLRLRVFVWLGWVGGGGGW